MILDLLHIYSKLPKIFNKLVLFFHHHLNLLLGLDIALASGIASGIAQADIAYLYRHITVL